MIRVRNAEALADNLETGIGEVGWYYELIPKELRLRLPVCGIASLAIANVLEEMGEKVKLVHSKPQLALLPEETHVFPVVYSDEHTPVIIDPTYSSFLRFAGLTPEGVLGGRPDAYPAEKIAVFERGDVSHPARLLARRAMKVRESRRMDSVPIVSELPFEQLSMKQMYITLMEFWNPQNYTEFHPSAEVEEAGQYVSGFIISTNLELIDE